MEILNASISILQQVKRRKLIKIQNAHFNLFYWTISRKMSTMQNAIEENERINTNSIQMVTCKTILDTSAWVTIVNINIILLI